jgi:hypothetical protein
MMIRRRAAAAVVLFCSIALCETSPAVAQAIPDAVAAKGEAVVLTVHGEGAQVYDCRAGDGGKLAWALREPVATLMENGKTIGRHYAGPGPTWELADGSQVMGKIATATRAAGATPKDVPWLKLDAAKVQSAGTFTSVTAIQRINTQGGQFEGACDKAGATFAVPYAADYLFLKKQ